MKFSTLHLLLLSLLLLLHSLVTLTYANPVLIKPAGYSLDCVSEGGEVQTYCFHDPHNYLCTDQGEVDSVTKSEFCESGCKCSKREGEKVPRLTEAEDVVGTGDSTPESPDFGDMTASTSMDLIPVNPSITKRHDYALVCVAPGTPSTWYSRLCSGSPYKYYCASDGKIHRQSVYTVCDVYCKCQKVPGQQCFVDRLGLAPICSETDPSSNGTDSTDLVPVSAVNEVSAESTEIPETPGLISKRHDYALVCEPPGTPPKYYSSYCSNSPYKYYCTSSGKLAYQNDFSVCDIYCKCKTVPGKNCFVDRLGLAPICSDADPSNNGTNSTGLDSTNAMDLNSTNSTDLDSINSTDLDMSDSTSLVPISAVEQISAESTEIGETSGSISKRHDYALVCNTGFGGTTYSRVCAGSPYKYYCSVGGKVYKQIADKLCDESCVCQHMNKQCIQAKILLPVCSDVNSTTSSTADLTSPTANVTEDGSQESTDTPSSAVASVPDDTVESTTTEIADTSADLAPASQHKRLVHNYALVCDDSYATGTLYTRYCHNYPRNYYCNSQGQIRYVDDDILCDRFCSCMYLAPSCYVHIVQPVCHNTETGEVTDMQTGAVVGYLDSNGTAVFFENSTLTG